MKVGSSPIYFIPNHSTLLERFSHHLKSKEKDAFELLKKEKFLQDKTQDPAIRVALRSIKDFAIPFEQNKELFWKYHTTPISEFIAPKTEKQEVTVPIATRLTIAKQEAKSLITSPKIQDKETTLNIFEEPKKETKTKKIKITKKPTSSKKEEKFFDKVKESLNSKKIILIDIESFSKNDLALKVQDKDEKKLLIAFNKRKIDEKDILKAHKKAQEVGLSYIIMSLGEPSKKLASLINATKSLSSIEKL